MRTHLVIPDTQITPDSPTDHLRWIGKYIAEKRPDVVIQIGDFNDCESLSSYDKGKKGFEGRRYIKDIEAGKKAMAELMRPIRKYNNRKRHLKEKLYRPE